MSEDQVAQTSLTDLLRAVPVAEGWRTHSENINDPMAGSYSHGDLLERAAHEIDTLRTDIDRLLASADRIVGIGGAWRDDPRATYYKVGRAGLEDFAHVVREVRERRKGAR